MTDILKKSNEYFSSLNPVAKKIAKEVKNYQRSFGEEWRRFPQEQKEEMINGYFVSAELACKYSTDNRTDRPQTFPVYKINNGEKVVVDFVEGCETWRDEHSGPFSWKTRSQQDLTLDDLEEDDKKNARSKFSRSPERTCFTAEQEKNETEDEIFRKFGITFSSSHSDDGASLPVGEEVSQDEAPLTPISADGYKNYAYADTSFEGINDSTDTDSKHEAEQSLITPPSPVINAPENVGHISPVYINDHGESSTDKFDFSDVVTLQPKSLNSQVVSTLDESEWKTSDDDEDVSSGETSAPTATGFDFLDNW